MAHPLFSAAGHLVAIGGAEDRTSDLEILKNVFALTPEGNREVAVIATASGIPKQVLPEYEAAFSRLGASQVHLLGIRDRREAADADTVRRIEKSGIIFFTGGDQLRLTNVLGGSPVLRAVRKRLQDGAVVAGTSAGAAAMPSTMIYNGAAADALRKGAVNMTSGLGFVDGLIIDSHFLERGRFTRLMEVGASNPEHLGVGLGEDAGVIMHPHGILEAIGPGHVILIDSLDLASSNIADLDMGKPVAVEHMILHALVSGHGFDVEARRYLVPHELSAALAESR
ncbi:MULTISPECIES: cyanophycinase [Halomonadaceae]|uniref:Cyanophycinase n=1 Tax=Vreelandella janggokensis TaxID=370767 RepID=A0ABT4IXZ1_9GAMM|nr:MULTISPECIES: cyanophycinase [Halomonas]MCW4148957.1 cyanophycinase [Halomonas sp. 18H]MCZ0927862.1 cyanophycinase [Halomonas janggokensis]MCZ0930680.1 cyanophycinase [Halomonas janggokensis]MDR5884514.1 cyanophycinase [Halomonas janggokensis]